LFFRNNTNRELIAQPSNRPHKVSFHSPYRKSNQSNSFTNQFNCTLEIEKTESVSAVLDIHATISQRANAWIRTWVWNGFLYKFHDLLTRTLVRHLNVRNFM